MEESQFQFLGYRVSKIDCQIKDDFGKSKEDIKQNINIENNYDANDKRFVEVVLNLTIKSNSESFFFFLKIKGGFRATSEMTDELFQSLSQQNGPAILYPYARSIVTNYTAQANVPPIILPTMNFVRKKKE